MQKRFIIFLMLFSCLCFSQNWDLQKCLNFADSTSLILKEAILLKENQKVKVKFQENKKLPFVSANINQGFNSGFDSFDYSAFQNSSSQINVESSIIIWNNKALKLNVETEKLRLQTSENQIQQVKFEIKIEIVSRFYAILLAKERIKIANQAVKNQENQLEKTHKLYEIGRIPLKDLNEIKANLVQDKQNLQSEKINHEKLKLELAHFLQLSDYQRFDVENPKEQDFNILYSLEEIMKINEQNNPKIKIGQLKLLENQNEINLLKTRFFPEIIGNYKTGSSLNYIFGNENLSLNNQLRNNFFTGVSVGIKVLIFS